MRLGESIWHCALMPRDDGVKEYENPRKYTTRLNYLVVQPASGYTKTVEFGENISRTWTITANYNQFDRVFKEGDLLFVDGNQPITGDNIENGEGANAVITSVRRQNLILYIIAQKLDMR